MRRLRGAAVVAVAYAAGSVPFSQLAARCFAGADLRVVGTGTVSGTSLYEVAGFGPLAVAGVCEVAKGGIGPLLAGRDHLSLGATATAAAIVGHNWSPWLRGAGGRGLSPALGATVVLAPEGTVLLLAAMVAGRLLRRSGDITLVGLLGLGPLLKERRGWPGAALGAAIVVPMVCKRLAGNGTGRPAGPLAVGRARLWSRLVHDREPDGAAVSPTARP